tara:strand:+ start:2779 stop:3009 length:231 start_codon:yes stop_codon:yes gene_type:complete
MNASQICSELDTIIHKLNNINQSCKNQEEKKEEAKQDRTENNLNTRDIPAAGYSGPQSNRSNSHWVGSLRSFWVRY